MCCGPVYGDEDMEPCLKGIGRLVSLSAFLSSESRANIIRFSSGENVVFSCPTINAPPCCLLLLVGTLDSLETSLGGGDANWAGDGNPSEVMVLLVIVCSKVGLSYKTSTS